MARLLGTRSAGAGPLLPSASSLVKFENQSAHPRLWSPPTPSQEGKLSRVKTAYGTCNGQLSYVGYGGQTSTLPQQHLHKQADTGGGPLILASNFWLNKQDSNESLLDSTKLPMGKMMSKQQQIELARSCALRSCLVGVADSPCMRRQPPIESLSSFGPILGCEGSCYVSRRVWGPAPFGLGRKSQTEGSYTLGIGNSLGNIVAQSRSAHWMKPKKKKPKGWEKIDGLAYMKKAMWGDPWKGLENMCKARQDKLDDIIFTKHDARNQDKNESLSPDVAAEQYNLPSSL